MKPARLGPTYRGDTFDKVSPLYVNKNAPPSQAGQVNLKKLFMMLKLFRFAGQL